MGTQDAHMEERGTAMTKQIFTCDDCGSEYTSAWACAYCCSPLNDQDDLNN